MKLPDINIIKSGMWQSPAGVYKSTPRFVHRYEIEYYTNSYGETWIDGVRYELSEGSIIFCTPGQMRFSMFPFGAKYIYFEISSKDEDFIAFLETLPNVVSGTIVIKSLFELMEAEHKRTDYITGLKINGALMECLCEIAAKGKRIPASKIHIHQKDIYNAISYMRKNIRKRKNVSDFANCTGYSIPHFNAIFKEVLKVTPYEYYMKLKISEAKRILLSGKYNTSEVAEMLGFSSSSHFCAAFKNSCRISPKEFVAEFNKENEMDYDFEI